jgi:hypothetical protein
MINKLNIIINHQVYKHNQAMHIIHLFRVFTIITKVHQCTYTPIHKSKYDSTHQLLNACNVLDSSRCMWYHYDFEDNFTVNESTNIKNATNYVLQKLCYKHHQLHSSNHLKMTMNAWTSSKDSTMHNSPTYTLT